MKRDEGKQKEIRFLEKQFSTLKKVFKESDKKKDAHQKTLQNEIVDKDRELDHKSKLLERIFANTHVLIAYFDRTFTYKQVNTAYAALHGKSIEYFNGKKYFNLNPHNRHKSIFTSVVKSGEPHFAFTEHFDSGKNGLGTTSFWDWSLQPIKDIHGIVEGLILILLDVTERVSTHKELEKAVDKLHKAQHLSDLGLLAATVAHELRNPISVIQAALYNIIRKKGEAPIDTQIATIEKKIMESEQIISNLLTYSRIKMPAIQEVDIIPLLHESIDQISQRFIDQETKVTFSDDSGGDTMSRIDPTQMKEVINNLLVNSYQAIHKKEGVIEVSITHRSPYVQMTVSDNGEGIKKSDIPHIFEPFFTRKSKGTGLGLAICRELVLLQNGRIFIDSTLHRGTSVKILIPCMEKPIAETNNNNRR
jgi:PAS domain S-box-containing protein